MCIQTGDPCWRIELVLNFCYTVKIFQLMKLLNFCNQCDFFSCAAFTRNLNIIAEIQVMVYDANFKFYILAALHRSIVYGCRVKSIIN